MLSFEVLTVCHDCHTAHSLHSALALRGWPARQIDYQRLVHHPHLMRGCGVIVVETNDRETDLAVCQMLRPLCRGALLLCTHETDEAYLLQAYQIGVDDCIQQPIGLDLLVAQVTAWCRRMQTRLPIHLGAAAYNDPPT